MDTRVVVNTAVVWYVLTIVVAGAVVRYVVVNVWTLVEPGKVETRIVVWVIVEAGTMLVVVMKLVCVKVAVLAGNVVVPVCVIVGAVLTTVV